VVVTWVDGDGQKEQRKQRTLCLRQQAQESKRQQVQNPFGLEANE